MDFSPSQIVFSVEFTLNVNVKRTENVNASMQAVYLRNKLSAKCVNRKQFDSMEFCIGNWFSCEYLFSLRNDSSTIFVDR